METLDHACCYQGITEHFSNVFHKIVYKLALLPLLIQRKIQLLLGIHTVTKIFEETGP